MISVKNTFITITNEDGVDHEFTRKRRISLPTHSMSLAQFSTNVSEFSPSVASFVNEGSPITRFGSTVVEPSFFPLGRRLSEEDVMPFLKNPSSIAPSDCNDNHVHQNRGWCDNTSNNDQILPSIGSQFHHTGECNPCAFLHKPRGCMEAYNCEFCHCCDKNDYITRKKIRAKKGKEIKRQAKLMPN